MATRAEQHVITSQELLTKALEALEQDDLLQAAEKGWGAAAHMVKGVAQRKGWRHHSHRELYQAVNRLAEEAGDNDLRLLFSLANALHSNFYENWMPKQVVEANLIQVREFLRRLEALP